jgi:hypothetical protein
MGLCLLLGITSPPWVLAAAPASTKGYKETSVRCDQGATIGRALSKLAKTDANVVRVSGACRENVVIDGFDNLRIVGKAGATLTPVPPATAYAFEVTASRAVSIEALTVQIADGRTAILMVACDNCLLKDVTIDGGIGLYAWWGSHVSLSRVRMTGTGGWTSIGAWDAVSLDIQDSTFEGPGGDWKCGLCVGANTTGAVFRTSFVGFGQAIGVDGGARVSVLEGTTIEDNWCGGAFISTGAQLTFDGSIVRNNASGCWNGGIGVDNSTLAITNTQVTGNTGGGIRLNHHAVAQLGAGTAVTSSVGRGLEVRNASIAVAPGDAAQTVDISANQGDLYCDSTSQINNSDQIYGVTDVACTNLWAGDGPP